MNTSKYATVKIHSIKNNLQVADKCYVADSFWKKTKGLIGTRSLRSEEALWITQCNSIHMWMMSLAIDAIFIKKSEAKIVGASDSWRVVSVFSNLKPWKLLPVGNYTATDTLELPQGTALNFDIQEGDLLCLS